MELKRQINRWPRISLLAWLFLTAGVANASPAIEIVPIIAIKPSALPNYSVERIRHLRNSFNHLRFIYMINPAVLMGEDQKFKETFSQLLLAGDSVGMHVAPLSPWLTASGIEFKDHPSFFSDRVQPCYILCGLEHSITKLTPAELQIFLSFGQKQFKESGLGSPKTILFEEGLIPQDLWTVAHKQNFEQDWSGFKPSTVMNTLNGSKFIKTNQELQTDILSKDQDNAWFQGRSLDAMRFGVWLEMSDVNGVRSVVEEAIAYARKFNRTIQFPLYLNSESLLHYTPLLAFAITNIYTLATTAEIKVQLWHDSDSQWDLDKLRTNIPYTNMAEDPLKHTGGGTHASDLTHSSGDEQVKTNEEQQIKIPPALELSH